MRRIPTQKMSVEQYRTHVRSIVVNIRGSKVILERVQTYETGLRDVQTLEERLNVFEDWSTQYETLRVKRDRVSDTFEEREDAFRRGAFKTATQHADYVFADAPDARDVLKLNDGVGSLKPHYTEWHPVASDFVQALQARPDLKQRMITGPFTPSDFDHLVDELSALDELYQERETLTIDRQTARRKRDAARAATDDALSIVQDLGALVVPDDTPDLMEAFGYVIPSEA